jgi:hypothetical protein
MTALDDLFNISSPFDIVLNYYNLTQELTGNMFIFIFLLLIFFSSWLISGKVLIPAVLFTIIGGPLMMIAPWELKQPALYMFIFGVVGIAYKWFKDR